jgi:hypothetical protein
MLQSLGSVMQLIPESSLAQAGELRFSAGCHERSHGREFRELSGPWPCDASHTGTGTVPFFATHHRLPTIGGNLPAAQEALNSLHDLFGPEGGREERGPRSLRDGTERAAPARRPCDRPHPVSLARIARDRQIPGHRPRRRRTPGIPPSSFCRRILFTLFRPSSVPQRSRPAGPVVGPVPRRFPTRMNPVPRTDPPPSAAGGRATPTTKGGPAPLRDPVRPVQGVGWGRHGLHERRPRAGGSTVSAPGNRTASPHNQMQASSSPGRGPSGHGGRRSGQEWNQPRRSDRLRWSNR